MFRLCASNVRVGSFVCNSYVVCNYPDHTQQCKQCLVEVTCLVCLCLKESQESEINKDKTASVNLNTLFKSNNKMRNVCFAEAKTKLDHRSGAALSRKVTEGELLLAFMFLLSKAIR